MGYWKAKVLPKIKKVFETAGSKKTAAAAEASKSFDESKEAITTELEEKKIDLQPKVAEVYEASPAEIKDLVKEPKEAGLKKQSVAINKFLEELVKIEFPGSKQVSEASSTYGPALVSAPVLFIFEKVSTFVPEVKTEETSEPTTEAAAAETSSSKDKEIIPEEEEKPKEEVKAEEVVAVEEQPKA